VESHSHRWPYGLSGPVTDILRMSVLRIAQAVHPATGRHWALHMQGFSVLWNRMLVAWHGISPRCSALFSVVGHDQRNNPGGPISTETRINERIRVPEVRLIGPGGEQVGIVRIEDALRVAVDADLDLVEVAPDAKPPVCKIMDYGKFKYETALKERESRKNQQQTVVKEQKLRPKIDPHDYETKKGHVVRFLEAGSKVKVTIMFRGREQSRPELGYRLLQKLGADVADYGFVETSAKLDGRNMTMVLAPHRGAKTKARAAHDAAAPPAQRASAAAAPAPAPAPAEAPTETPDPTPT
jgi:translation initiation factor IF-3